MVEQTMLLTVEEAGQSLRIGRSLLLSLLYSGELRSVKVGRRRLVPVSALEEYVEKLKAEQGAADGVVE